MPTWRVLGELRERIREFSRPPEPVRVLRGLCEDYCFAKDAYAFLASISSPAERPHDDAHFRKYEALWQHTRLNFQRMTGDDIAKTIDTAEAKKARWRAFGNYKSGRQRMELRWRGEVPGGQHRRAPPRQDGARSHAPRDARRDPGSCLPLAPTRSPGAGARATQRSLRGRDAMKRPTRDAPDAPRDRARAPAGDRRAAEANGAGARAAVSGLPLVDGGSRRRRSLHRFQAPS